MDTPNEKITIKQLHGLVQQLVTRVNVLEAQLKAPRTTTPTPTTARREAMRKAREEAQRTGKCVSVTF